MKFSVIIPTYDDNADLLVTLQSLFSIPVPEGHSLEVVVIDDHSTPPFSTLPGAAQWLPRITLRILPRRVGVGSARHIGAEIATGGVLIFVDSHMLFPVDFLKVAADRFHHPKLLYCGSCAPVVNNQIEVRKRYFGATWNMYGPDRNLIPLRKMPHPRNMRRGVQVFETVWGQDQQNEEYELSAVMGACYMIDRSWFLELSPLRHLRSWGGDEAILSLKCWLSGGHIRMLRSWIVGHKFKKTGHPPIHSFDPLYNKLFTIYTCTPPDIALWFKQCLMRTQPNFTFAYRALIEDWHLVESERAMNDRLFTRGFREFCHHFGFTLQ